MSDSVEDLKSKDGMQEIRAFKRLREFYDVPEKKVCTACPRKDQCPLKFKIPNVKFLAGSSDVYSVLAAYSKQAESLEKAENSQDLDSMIDMNPEMSDDELRKLDLRRLYGLKMKDAIIVLNSLAKLSQSQLDKSDFFQEKFGNAIALYEHEAGLDKYSTSIEDRKAKGFKRPNTEVSLRPDFQGKYENIKSGASSQTKGDLSTSNSTGGLSEKRQAYLQKFDEKVSLTPMTDAGSTMMKKKGPKNKESYLDSVKKKASTAVNVHFLKESKKKLDFPVRKGGFSRENNSRINNQQEKEMSRNEAKFDDHLIIGKDANELRDPFEKHDRRRPKSEPYTPKTQSEDSNKTYKDRQSSSNRGLKTPRSEPMQPMSSWKSSRERPSSSRGGRRPRE